MIVCFVRGLEGLRLVFALLFELPSARVRRPSLLEFFCSSLNNVQHRSSSSHHAFLFLALVLLYFVGTSQTLRGSVARLLLLPVVAPTWQGQVVVQLHYTTAVA